MNDPVPIDTHPWVMLANALLARQAAPGATGDKSAAPAWRSDLPALDGMAEAVWRRQPAARQQGLLLALSLHAQGLSRTRDLQLSALVQLLRDTREECDSSWMEDLLALARITELFKSIESLAEALALAVDAAPDHAPLKAALAKACLNAKLYDRALQPAAALVDAEPDEPEWRGLLAHALVGLRRQDAARQVLHEALTRWPDDSRMLEGMARWADAFDQPAEAMPWLEKAYAMAPERHTLGLNLAIVWMRLDRPQQAHALLSQLALAQPGHTGVLMHLAFAQGDLGLVDEAIRTYEQVLDVDPHHPKALPCLSLLLLLQGRWQDGLRLYESRLLEDGMQHPDLDPARRWQGQPMAQGSTLLIEAEQGLGDTLQFCRLALGLGGQGVRVILRVQAALMPLLSASQRWSDCGVALASRADPLPAHDWHVPLLSLPRITGQHTEVPWTQGPYLFADPDRQTRWQDRLRQALAERGLAGQPVRLIGVCWQGSTGLVDRGRSFPLSALAPVAQVPGVVLVSLHRGSGESQAAALPPGMTLLQFGDELDREGAFLDTAAIMGLCERVITSDNSVAHLAGGLQVPTWVALKPIPDWRWLLARADSPWYPSLRLFRRALGEDWQPVMQAMARELILAKD